MFSYKINEALTVDEIISVLVSSGINRPVTNKARIGAMFQNADLVISVWHEDKLIGVARALTDWSYCCYLSDLAVSKDFQNTGIGTELIAQVRKQIGEGCMLLLLSAPAAMGFYPKINMEQLCNAFIFHRTL